MDKINKTFQHKFLPYITCVVLEKTNKGYKVKQKEDQKEKIQFYYDVDFDERKGFWKLLN